MHTTFARHASVLSAMLLSATAHAQNLAEADRSALPRECGHITALFVADLDGDGTTDIVAQTLGVFAAPDNLIAIVGDGLGRWHTRLRDPNAVAIGAADIDNDGDVDIVLDTAIAANDGNGTFTIVPFPGTPIGPGDRGAIADFTGDGLPDVIVTSRYQSAARFYVNQGGLTFTDVTATNLPALGLLTAIEPFDADGDGDVDLFVSGSADQLLLNQNGVLVPAPAGSLPAFGGTMRAQAFDIDGDNDQDLVLGSFQMAPRLYLNQGGAVFADASATLGATPTDGTWSIAIGDVDGDLDPDIVLGQQTGGLLLRNQGGTFAADVAAFDAGGTCTTALTLADVDGDGDLDLLQGGADTSPSTPPQHWANQSHGVEPRLLWNDGSGSFHATTRDDLPTFDGATSHAATGDVTGDGFPDLLLDTGTLLANDRVGGFVASPAALPAGTPLLGDLDGDGDLDGVVVSGSQFSSLRNDGTGVFTAWQGPFAGTGVELGDVDGDGRADLVGNGSLWLGQPGGAFVDASATWFGTLAGGALTLGDLDGDGDLDAFCDGAVYLNTGTAFVATTYPTGSYGFGCVALGDLDGDGDLDGVIGKRNQWAHPNGNDPPNVFAINDGNGNFTASTAPGTHYTGTWSVAIADTDGDGDLDVLFGNGYRDDYRNALLRNVGGGSWDTSSTDFAFEAEDTRQVLFADLDRDGDPDAIAINRARNGASTPRTKVYHNLTRQLIASPAARLGKPYTLDVHGAVLGAGIWLSLSSANTPTPFGTLGLGPATLGPLTLLPPPATGTTAAITFALPNLGSLAGLPIYVQAIDVATLRLTNTLQETLRSW